MKKLFFLSLVLGLSLAFVSDTFAYAAIANKPLESKVQIERNYTKKLAEAINRRWQNLYMKHQVRNAGRKNILNQLERHKDSKYFANTDERSTQLRRTGPLTQDYEARREISKRRTDAVNTSKRNFRRRAINYYVDGGDANAEVLEQGIRASTHRVKRIPNSYYNRGLYDSDIKNHIRNIQRYLGRPNKVGAAQQRQRAIQKGASYRNFLHPFMSGSQQ